VDRIGSAVLALVPAFVGSHLGVVTRRLLGPRDERSAP
jgi:hypothetical protein